MVRTFTHFARQTTSSEQRTLDLRIVAAAAERGTTLTDWLASTAEHEPHAQDQPSGKDFLSAVAVRLQLLVLPGTHIETNSGLEDAAFSADRARLKHVLISLPQLQAEAEVEDRAVQSGEMRQRRRADLPARPPAGSVKTGSGS